MTALAPVPATVATRTRPWGAAAAASAVGLLLGVLCVAAVGLLTGTGRFAGESAKTKAMRVLRADQADLAAATSKLAQARRVHDLRAAGEFAQASAERLRGRDVPLALLDDRPVQAVAERAHRATIAALSGIAGLQEVSASRLDAWDAGERQVIDALGDLDAVAALVAAMDPQAPLRVDTRKLETTAGTTSTYLTTAAGRLARYERRMVSFRRKNRAKLQRAADYRASVETQMAAYRQTRRDLQDYIDDVKTFDDRIPQFRRTLRDARAKRQSIRGTLASMTPVPGLASQHQALVAVLDKAIAGTESGIDLADATQQLRDEGGDGSGFDLPEYRRFQEMSAEITRERDAAMATWTRGVEAYVRKLKHPKGAPHKPAV
jgi:hypothetical protein